MSTCGDAECVLPSGHGGHYHAGPDEGGSIRKLWPKADAPSYVKLLGVVKAYLPVPEDGSDAFTPQVQQQLGSEVVLRNIMEFRRDELAAFSILQHNRHSSTEPYGWFGPADEPCPAGPDCECQGCFARFNK